MGRNQVLIATVMFTTLKHTLFLQFALPGYSLIFEYLSKTALLA